MLPTIKKYQTFVAKPYSPVLGAEIYGIDLTQPLNNQQKSEINDAFLTYGVLFFKEQKKLDPQQQLDLGKHWGALHTHPAKIPTVDGYPEIIKIYADENSTVANGTAWHTDVTFEKKPPMGTMLQIHTKPEVGGDTLYSNLYTAYDALSEPIKKLCQNLTQRCSGHAYHKGRYAERGVNNNDQELPDPVDHPVIRTHPVTGKKAIFVNKSFTECINDLTKVESDNILHILFEQAEKPEHQIRYRWSVNDLAFWDNRCVMHYAMFDYWPQLRVGHRVTIIGDQPY